MACTVSPIFPASRRVTAPSSQIPTSMKSRAGQMPRRARKAISWPHTLTGQVKACWMPCCPCFTRNKQSGPCHQPVWACLTVKPWKKAGGNARLFSYSSASTKSAVKAYASSMSAASATTSAQLPCNFSRRKASTKQRRQGLCMPLQDREARWIRRKRRPGYSRHKSAYWPHAARSRSSGVRKICTPRWPALT